MTHARTLVMLALIVALGAVGALVAAALVGMDASELAHLGALLGAATVVTVGTGTLASFVLPRTSMRHRFVTIAAVATLVALANLWALSRSMFISSHDASVLAVVLVYASASGLAAAVAAAGSSADALERLTRAMNATAEGDLSVRVGALRAGPELERLAASFDRMIEQLEDLRRREQHVEQTRSDLITAVSHDLRTPLSSLRAMVEAVDEGVVADARTLRRYVREMGRSVGQLGTMVDDLFELVQVDAGAIEVETERARLEDVVASAVATVQAEAERRQIHVRCDLGGAEEAMCSPRVARVLQNLLVNAIRHTPADGTVRVEGRRSAERLCVIVQDSGDGIAPEHLQHVFEPFYRTDAARSADGSGLGLALVHRIVLALGGTISVRSAPTQGARFEMTLPLAASTPGT
jgi:two-component system, OmpR family, sensor histidine kinase SaeS